MQKIEILDKRNNRDLLDLNLEEKEIIFPNLLRNGALYLNEIGFPDKEIIKKNLEFYVAKQEKIKVIIFNPRWGFIPDFDYSRFKNLEYIYVGDRAEAYGPNKFFIYFQENLKNKGLIFLKTSIETSKKLFDLLYQKKLYIDPVIEFLSMLDGLDSKSLEICYQLLTKKNLSLKIFSKNIKLNLSENINVYAGLIKTLKKYSNKINSLTNLLDMYKKNVEKFINSGTSFISAKLDYKGYFSLKKMELLGVKLPIDLAYKGISPNSKIIFFRDLVDNNAFIFDKQIEDFFLLFSGNDNFINLSKMHYEKISFEKNFLNLIKVLLKKGKNVVLYLGGHGDRNGNMYIEISKGKKITITKDFLKKIIESSKGSDAKLTLIITSCFSGYKFDDLEKIVKDYNVDIILDSSYQTAAGGESGTETKNLSFLQMTNARNFVDLNGDGLINLHEIYFVRNFFYTFSLTPLYFHYNGDVIPIN